MKKLINLFLILFLILLISCIENIYILKIKVLNNDGEALNSVNVKVGDEIKKTDKNGEVEFRLIKGEYKIYVESDKFFPYENKIILDKNFDLEVKLDSISEKRDEIIQKILNKIKDTKKFDIQFIGNMNGSRESFNVKIDLSSLTFILNSNILKKELVIRKENDKYFYNENEIPNEVNDYFPQIIKIISDSIEFIKNLPILINEYEIRLSNNYLVLSYMMKRENLNVEGFIVSDLNLKIISDQINIVAIDEMKRVNEIFINIYNIN
jgi:hypothetical protein